MKSNSRGRARILFARAYAGAYTCAHTPAHTRPRTHAHKHPRTPAYRFNIRAQRDRLSGSPAKDAQRAAQLPLPCGLAAGAGAGAAGSAAGFHRRGLFPCGPFHSARLFAAAIPAGWLLPLILCVAAAAGIISDPLRAGRRCYRFALLPIPCGLAAAADPLRSCCGPPPARPVLILCGAGSAAVLLPPVPVLLPIPCGLAVAAGSIQRPKGRTISGSKKPEVLPACIIPRHSRARIYLIAAENSRFRRLCLFCRFCIVHACVFCECR